MLIENVKIDPQEQRWMGDWHRMKKQGMLRQQESSHSTQVGKRFTGFQKIYHMMANVVMKWKWRDQLNIMENVKNSNLMQNLYIIINQWGQWCTHTHKCCDIGLVLPWGDMPWNKNVIKLVNLVICENI